MAFAGTPKLALAALMLALPTGALAGGPPLYPYATSANYCPPGLQPVTINGAICCGVPNQHLTYQQVMQHPVQRKRVHDARRGYIPAGKGIPTGKGLGD
jgi:hypothetical protein